MGFLLREALKHLCSLNHWSYAVFWKLGCQNSKLLIWEECYYEPLPWSALPHISGIENSELSFEEWDECWASPQTHTSQLRGEVRDKVHSLINRMTMSNQVNVVGEGMIGRAAFTGCHQWILSENYIRGVHPPEVLNEVHHQYSAGMQTVAVIPVLPHGVVQLGSSLVILENMEFVNDVKSLILQLGCVPGALLSDIKANESPQKIGIPISLGMSVPVGSSGNFKINSTSFVTDRCNKQSNSSLTSKLIGEPSDSLERQIPENPQNNALTNQIPYQTQTLEKLHDDHCQPKVTPVVKSNLLSRGHLENGVTGATVSSQNVNAWQKQQASFYNPGSGFNRPGVGQSCTSHGSLRLIEQQMLSDTDLWGRVNSQSEATSQSRANGGVISSIHKSFVLEGSELDNGMTGHLRQPKVPRSLSSTHISTDFNTSSTLQGGGGLHKPDLSRTEVESSGQLTTSHVISRGSDHIYDSKNNNPPHTELAPRKKRLENNSFHAIRIPLAHSDEHTHLRKHIPGILHDCEKNKSESGYPRPRNATYGDAYVQPSSGGDDLFDVLGADFKNKLLYGNWNSSLINGPDGSLHNLGTGTSTSKNLVDADPALYSVSEGTSVSGIFSGTENDHLLDAVISKVHSAAKQSSDDNTSCRTTLTKNSRSSVPSTSPIFGHISVCNQMKGDIFSLPKSIGKDGIVGSSSYKSGCSKDDTENCSQSSSIYGSQISSWVEQDHNVKRDSSVSTAYSKRPDVITKSNRKRLKPGENPRPRPKDRQMIQDRVKELREIIPNGGKCSIDALLERTTKHMLFLQSVTKHADKLKHSGESKIISKGGGLLLNDNFGGGATWAFEVGSQSMVCPIVVEDLNPPRQMLVEMLCEERGFFLEIADIIRGLGLTILKGVMEARNDKIWAHFVVEANRDVTRMEIFISLVRLLEETIKINVASSSNMVDNGSNMMVHPCTGN